MPRPAAKLVAVPVVGGTTAFRAPSSNKDMPWPPVACVGEAPSALHTLANLLDTDNEELWRFVAKGLVERMNDEPRLRSRSKDRKDRDATKSPAKQQWQDHLNGTQTLGAPNDNDAQAAEWSCSGSIPRKVRLADMLENPLPPGLVPGTQQFAPGVAWMFEQHTCCPNYTECSSAPPMDAKRLQEMLLKVGSDPTQQVEKVRLMNIPQDWDEGCIHNALKCIGLCMQCDVASVQREKRNKLLISLNSQVAAEKCLGLDGFLVQQGGEQWPLRALPVKAKAGMPKPQGTKMENALRAEDLEQKLKVLKEPMPTNMDKTSNIADDLAGTGYPQDSMDRLAQELLRGALATPAEKKVRQCWADCTDDLPDQVDLLQALMK